MSAVAGLLLMVVIVAWLVISFVVRAEQLDRKE